MKVCARSGCEAGAIPPVGEMGGEGADGTAACPMRGPEVAPSPVLYLCPTPTGCLIPVDWLQGIFMTRCIVTGMPPSAAWEVELHKATVRVTPVSFTFTRLAPPGGPPLYSGT